MLEQQSGFSPEEPALVFRPMSEEESLVVQQAQNIVDYIEENDYEGQSYDG